jgi:hypothetical protein
VAASPYARLSELSQRLTSATTTRAIKWVPEPGKDTSFVYGRKNGSVVIRSRDGDGEPPYELVLYNAEGNRIETLESYWEDRDEPAFWNRSLEELYRAARGNALGIDELIDEIMSELPEPEVDDDSLF